eukprot:402393_1
MHNMATSSSTIAMPPSQDYGDYVNRCICGKNLKTDEEGKYMLQCDKCQVWQHGACMGVSEAAEPENYFCEKCRPNDPIHRARRKRVRKEEKKQTRNEDKKRQKTAEKKEGKDRKRKREPATGSGGDHTPKRRKDIIPTKVDSPQTPSDGFIPATKTFASKLFLDPFFLGTKHAKLHFIKQARRAKAGTLRPDPRDLPLAKRIALVWKRHCTSDVVGDNGESRRPVVLDPVVFRAAVFPELFHSLIDEEEIKKPSSPSPPSPRQPSKSPSPSPVSSPSSSDSEEQFLEDDGEISSVEDESDSEYDSAQERAIERRKRSTRARQAATRRRNKNSPKIKKVQNSSSSAKQAQKSSPKIPKQSSTKPTNSTKSPKVTKSPTITKSPKVTKTKSASPKVTKHASKKSAQPKRSSPKTALVAKIQKNIPQKSKRTFSEKVKKAIIKTTESTQKKKGRPGRPALQKGRSKTISDPTRSKGPSPLPSIDKPAGAATSNVASGSSNLSAVTLPVGGGSLHGSTLTAAQIQQQQMVLMHPAYYQNLMMYGGRLPMQYAQVGQNMQQAQQQSTLVAWAAQQQLQALQQQNLMQMQARSAAQASSSNGPVAEAQKQFVALFDRTPRDSSSASQATVVPPPPPASDSSTDSTSGDQSGGQQTSLQSSESVSAIAELISSSSRPKTPRPTADSSKIAPTGNSTGTSPGTTTDISTGIATGISDVKSTGPLVAKPEALKQEQSTAGFAELSKKSLKQLAASRLKVKSKSEPSSGFVELGSVPTQTSANISESTQSKSASDGQPPLTENAEKTQKIVCDSGQPELKLSEHNISVDLHKSGRDTHFSRGISGPQQILSTVTQQIQSFPSRGQSNPVMATVLNTAIQPVSHHMQSVSHSMKSANQLSIQPQLTSQRSLQSVVRSMQSANKPTSQPQSMHSQTPTQSSHQGSMQSSRQGSMQSSHQGSMQSSHQGSMQSSRQGSMQSSHQGSMQSSHQGSMQSSHQGSMQSAAFQPPQGLMQSIPRGLKLSPGQPPLSPASGNSTGSVASSLELPSPQLPSAPISDLQKNSESK